MHQEIVIDCDHQETRVAILEDKKLEAFFIERHDMRRIVGNIYKGIVESILPGMGSSFVNLGIERNGFLYVSDVVTPELTYEKMIEDAEEIAPAEQKKKHQPHISELLKKGEEIMVQVVKDAIRTKGPRLTTQISLPGYFVVLMPYAGQNGISKRIEDRAERDQIRKTIEELKLPEQIGVIVRTAAHGVDKRDLVREIRYLQRLWLRIKDRSKRGKAPLLAYEEYNLVLRTARDMMTNEVAHIEIDSKQEYRQLVKFLSAFSPKLKSKVRLFRGRLPIFDHYDIEKQIDQIYARTVGLRCGGSIVIDETESLVAIDVNSGKFVGRRNLEDTVFKTNLEAAEEIARQIRLRDIGGIIAIDFIDMEVLEHRRRILRTLEDALRRDKAKTKILNISGLGVVEMSRQRMRRSLEGVIYQDCPYCSGRGLVKTPSTVSIELTRRIGRFVAEGHRSRELFIFAHPDVVAHIVNPQSRIIPYLEKRFGRRIRVIEDTRAHIEDVRIEEKTSW